MKSYLRLSWLNAISVMALILTTNIVLLLPANCQTGTVTLFASKPYICTSLKDQWFQDTLTLKPGQEKLPLTLIVVNGSDHNSQYNWFRITIGGYLVATEKSMNGASEATIDVSGQIQLGSNQVIIEAGGKVDSSLSFWLTSKGVALSYVHPRSAQLSDSVTLVGTNFSSNASDNTVFFDSKPAQILSATSHTLSVRVPQNCDIGINQLSVRVNGLSSNQIPIYITSAPAPQLLSLEYWMVPPGAEMTIHGKNFASKLSDNKVYFSNVPAEIVSGDTESIVVVVPQWSYGPSEINIPISVVSNNVPSINQLPIDIGPRFCGQIPQFPQD